MKIKRVIYICSFTILGFLLAVLLYGLGGLIEEKKFLVILLVIFGFWGFKSGIHWWHLLYDLKKYDKRWWRLHKWA